MGPLRSHVEGQSGTGSYQATVGSGDPLLSKSGRYLEGYLFKVHCLARAACPPARPPPVAGHLTLLAICEQVDPKGSKWTLRFFTLDTRDHRLAYFEVPVSCIVPIFSVCAFFGTAVPLKLGPACSQMLELGREKEKENGSPASPSYQAARRHRDLHNQQ